MRGRRDARRGERRRLAPGAGSASSLRARPSPSSRHRSDRPTISAPAPCATSATPRRPAGGEDRLGDDPGGPLDDQGGVGEQPARVAPLPPAVRDADEPQRCSRGAREPRAELERRPVVPRLPRTARPPDRPRPGLSPQQERHVAGRSLEHDGRGAAERVRRRRPSSSRSTPSCAASRATSSPIAGEENAAVRVANPVGDQLVACERQPRRGRGQVLRVHDGRDDQLPGGIAHGERLREAEERVERVRRGRRNQHRALRALERRRAA